MTPEERLNDHIDQFNACVRTGHFAPYTRLFTEDAELKLLGPQMGNYRGHEQIAAACSESLSDDTVRIVTVLDATPTNATFDYAHGRAPKDVAGQVILRWVHEGVELMTVTLH